MQKPLLIILGGPTGVGKTKTAIQLAQSLNTEIISADSRQIFKEMSIGTAVPEAGELNLVKHHFIQSHSVHEVFNASKYEEEVIKKAAELFKIHNKLVMAGGSGMYIDAVIHGIDELPAIPAAIRSKYFDIHEKQGLEALADMVKAVDPEYYSVVDRKNPKRLQKALEVFELTGKPYSTFLKQQPKERGFNTIIIVLDLPRDELYERINKRVDLMVEAGLESEARNLYSLRHLTPLKTVGYREWFDYFDGTISRTEAIEQIKNHTRTYARKQLTWVRKYKDAHWFNPNQTDEIVKLVKSK